MKITMQPKFARPSKIAQSSTAEKQLGRGSTSVGRAAGAFAVLGALVLGACGTDDSSPVSDIVSQGSDSTAQGATSSDVCANATGSITVYSGRNENLVGELYSQFTAQTGIAVEARYGDSGELAGQILTEGASTPADVFFSQDAGALGAIAQADLFSDMDSSILDRIDPAFRSEEGVWVGTSGRVRVIVFNPDLAPAPPTSIDELLDPQWKGLIGFAPTNASWQSFVTALRVLRGEDGARSWLEGFAANEPKAYEKNGAVRDGVDSGEVALGLVNHYYLYEKIAAEGADSVTAKNQFLSAGDPGGLVNVAGAGILSATDSPAAAACFVSYLVSEAGQTYFVTESYEYPLVDGIAPYEGLPEFETLQPPSLDLSDLSSIAATQELLADVGLLTL